MQPSSQQKSAKETYQIAIGMAGLFGGTVPTRRIFLEATLPHASGPSVARFAAGFIAASSFPCGQLAAAGARDSLTSAVFLGRLGGRCCCPLPSVALHHWRVSGFPHHHPTNLAKDLDAETCPRRALHRLPPPPNEPTGQPVHVSLSRLVFVGLCSATPPALHQGERGVETLPKLRTKDSPLAPGTRHCRVPCGSASQGAARPWR